MKKIWSFVKNCHDCKVASTICFCIFAVLVLMICSKTRELAQINDSNNQLGQAQARVQRLLPPMLTNPSLLPTPLRAERHLGFDWIITKPKKNSEWDSIIYYPNVIHILSMKIIAFDNVEKGDKAPPKVSCEVTAFYTDASGNQATEVFRFAPTSEKRPLFISAFIGDLQLLQPKPHLLAEVVEPVK